MSIQLNNVITIKDIFASNISLVQQIFKRSRVTTSPKVFFRYKNFRTHLGFNSYYHSPPVSWSNWRNAELIHWINYPSIIDNRPFIIESNDHPLAAGAWKKPVEEPWQVLKNIDYAHKVYNHPNCRAILIPCEGFRQLFSYYFPGEFEKKLLISPLGITCEPKLIDWKTRELIPITFACLASDYTRKGVDLVLKAWLSIEKPKGVRLILACANIPENILKTIKGDTSILVIPKPRLSKEEKDQILRNSHISLAPTHIHGGTNVMEGIEYGHAPILFDYHLRAFDSLSLKVPVPYHFYTPEKYGKEWKTFSEFFNFLQKDKQSGQFDITVDKLIQTIKEIMNNPKNAIDCGEKAIVEGNKIFSVKNRNQNLLKIYHEVLENN